MNSRDTILQSIKESLKDLTKRSELPPAPEVWPIENLANDKMIEIFSKELSAVQGEIAKCENIFDATEKIKRILLELGAKKIGLLDKPLIREIAEQLGSEFEFQTAPDTAKLSEPDSVVSSELEKLDVGIVSPEFLLADTGSCLFFLPNAFDRLLCYIVPVCIVVASKNMLREHLPHAWIELQEKFGSAETIQNQVDAQTTGEFLIMTGPSRTADIEKVLILGVHGPKRLLVFLVD